MIISGVRLHDYRNYEDLSLSFDEGINILYGDNAQGKTNILEALYLSGTTKSHRGSRDKEIIRFGKEEGHINTKIKKDLSEHEIDIHLRKNKTKGIAINKIPIKKASELFGLLNMVFFSPEDLNIIKNGPSERRHFMDAELCQIDRVYLYHLKNYNKALDQRNKLLKDIAKNPSLKDTLSVWNVSLLEYGIPVIQRRAEFLKDLNEIVREIHSSLSGGKEDMKISYEPDVSAVDFEMKLLRSEDRDLFSGTTTSGPHRDDIKFTLNNVDIRKFGSQGQQRTGALSLKLSEIRLMEEVIHDKPVLLLDDVLSELDSNRQNYLLKQITGTQTMITCTGLDEFVKNHFEGNRTFEVKEGKARVIDGTSEGSEQPVRSASVE